MFVLLFNHKFLLNIFYLNLAGAATKKATFPVNSPEEERLRVKCKF